MSTPLFDTSVFDDALFGGAAELFDDAAFDSVVFEVGGATGVDATATVLAATTTAAGGPAAVSNSDQGGVAQRRFFLSRARLRPNCWTVFMASSPSLTAR